MKRILINAIIILAVLVYSWNTIYWSHANRSVYYWFFHFSKDLSFVSAFLYTLQSHLLLSKKDGRRSRFDFSVFFLIVVFVTSALRAGYLSDIGALYNFLYLCLENSLMLLVIIIPALIINRLVYFKVNWLRLGKISAGLVMVAILSSLIIKGLYNHQEDTLFNKKNQKYLIDATAINKLSEIQERPEFKGKKVWIDMWFSSCKPCIEDFQSHPGLRDSLLNKGWEVLYIGRPTSHPNSYQRWLSVIEKYNLEGYHIYMNENLENDISTEVQNHTNTYFAYPHYLVMDSEGNIDNWSADYNELYITEPR